MMVSLARNEGGVFYATADRPEPNGGSFALGLRDLNTGLKDWKVLF